MFYGNIVSKIPGGISVQKYGGKIILLIAVFLSAIVLTITPLAVTYGKFAFYICTKREWYFCDLKNSLNEQPMFMD